MKAISTQQVLCALLMLVSTAAPAESISAAHYADPVMRYGHFALGKPHEYARLVVTTSNGRTAVLTLPEDEVFEDLAPRIVRLAAADETGAILSIVSNRDSGARLVLFRLSDESVVISAQSKPVGSPMRWLNPVGVADLDGDGVGEIAAVITPHIGGILKVYKQDGDALLEIAALAGFSNHVYRSAELALSIPVSVDGQMRLLVPDITRRDLRLIALNPRTANTASLMEIGRCTLAAPLSGALRALSPRDVSVSGTTPQVIALSDCLKQ